MKSFETKANIVSEPYKIPLALKPENYANLLYEIFSFHFGKIPNLENLLLWFPDFLLKYHQTYQLMMLGEGPLPISWRFFIGIMAASCYGCDYLLNRLMMHFIKTGGDIKWLEMGLKKSPLKLQKLSEVNLILAFAPWKLRLTKFFSVKIKKKVINYKISIKIIGKQKRRILLVKK